MNDMRNKQKLNCTPTPYPCYVPFGCMCGCDREPEHKEDCYYFDNVQDMGAHIPTCDYHHELGYCPCDGCNKYIRRSEVAKIVREYVDGRED